MSFLYLTLVIVVGVPTGFPHPTTIVNPWRLQLCCLCHGHATQPSMLGGQVTPQSCSWSPTACTGCSCPSGPSSGASENGPKWFPIPKNLGFKKIRSLACSEAELLHKVLLDLLQPVQAVLALQAHLGPLRMVPNDSPYPKTWFFKKKAGL